MTDDEYRKAIAANAARAHISYRNGDDISGDYWTEQAQRLSDQYEAARTRRHCGPAISYAKPSRIDLWNTPTASSGAFPEAKRSGDVLGGARKADRS